MKIQTPADYSSIEAISERLIEASDAIGNMASRVAMARQVRDYDGDRRKKALSCAVKDSQATGAASITAAEHQARASESYANAMLELSKSYRSAEQTIAEWEAAKIKWETARSLLSIQKQLVTNL